jgi:hypothetical protein
MGRWADAIRCRFARRSSTAEFIRVGERDRRIHLIVIAPASPSDIVTVADGPAADSAGPPRL